MAILDAGSWATPAPAVINLLSQLGFFVCMIYFSIALATGLYYVAELAEENTVTARKVLKYWLLAIIALQCVMYLLDGVPFTQCAMSIVANVVYSMLLKNYPFTTLSSPATVLSLLLFCADTIVWYWYFTDPYTPGFTVSQIIGYFGTCVWPVPFGFFVTLSLADQNLPGMVSIDSSSGSNEFKKRRGLLGIFDSLFKKEPSAAFTKGF